MWVNTQLSRLGTLEVRSPYTSQENKPTVGFTTQTHEYFSLEFSVYNKDFFFFLLKPWDPDFG